VVDDHHVARTTVRALLDAHSMAICGEAEDGQKALEQVKALKPDLVLLDINMPVMNGIQTAFEIRRLAPATKILFFTVQEFTPEAEAAVRLLGAQGFVNKSEAGTQLIPAVKRLLRSEL
jgi:DNA-binding NarL/FixJ family response regulator